MNVFAFAGNITRDIEVKSTQGGKKVATFGIAINEGKDKTTFLNCVAWEKTAELIAEYCKKGDRLSGSGRIDIRSYEQDGVKKYSTEVIVQQFDFPPKGQAESTGGGKAVKNPVMDELEDSIPFAPLKGAMIAQY